MARIRSLKPEFWDDRKLARSVSRDSRMLYMGLWNQADEHGRLNGDELWLKGRIFPYDDDVLPDDITGMLDQLEDAGRIRRYMIDGDPFIYLPKLAKHQRLEPAKVDSRIPAPPADSDADNAEPKKNESGPRADESAQDAESSTLLYVAGSMGHDGAPRAAQTGKREPDELWNAIVEVCGIESKTTKTQSSLIGKVRRELAEVDATPEQVRIRASRWRQRYREAELTPAALVKHWASLGDSTPPQTSRPQDIYAALSRPGGQR